MRYKTIKKAALVFVLQLSRLSMAVPLCTPAPSALDLAGALGSVTNATSLANSPATTEYCSTQTLLGSVGTSTCLDTGSGSPNASTSDVITGIYHVLQSFECGREDLEPTRFRR